MGNPDPRAIQSFQGGATAHIQTPQPISKTQTQTRQGGTAAYTQIFYKKTLIISIITIYFNTQNPGGGAFAFLGLQRKQAQGESRQSYPSFFHYLIVFHIIHLALQEHTLH